MKKETIELLARGVCVVRGRVLLCRSKGAAIAYLPGGHVEFRETARHALEREVLEELGLPSRAGRLLGCAEHAFKQHGEWHAEFNVLFELRIPSLRPPAPPPSAEDGLSFEWRPLKELRRARLEPAALIPQLARWLRKPGGLASSAKGWTNEA